MGEEMTLKSFNNLLSYGDVIELELNCDASKCLDNICKFEWKQYNPRKNVNRFGLSVTSEYGTMNGIDLDSLSEYNIENGTRYSEESFTEFTEVYYECDETKKLVEPFRPWLARTHYLNFRTGGFFPPHRDQRSIREQAFMRILVPITTCNPPSLWFIMDEKPLHFQTGNAYFVNTNKMHTIFSFGDNAYMLVMNVKCTDESIKKVGELTRWK
jgi:hypothetical protein